MPETNNNSTLMIGIGAVAIIGYLLLEGDLAGALPTSSGGISNPGGGTTGAGSRTRQHSGTYGSGDPFEDATNTGTTPVGTTATKDEFKSIVQEIKGGFETPTRRAGGHVR